MHDTVSPRPSPDDLVEPIWLASPDDWRSPFNPWRDTNAMVMAGQRPCGTLPAAMVVKR